MRVPKRYLVARLRDLADFLDDGKGGMAADVIINDETNKLIKLIKNGLDELGKLSPIKVDIYEIESDIADYTSSCKTGAFNALKRNNIDNLHDLLVLDTKHIINIRTLGASKYSYLKNCVELYLLTHPNVNVIPYKEAGSPFLDRIEMGKDHYWLKEDS